MVVIDTHLARGSSNGGATLHDRGGPYGRTLGAKRVVAVDVTGLPVGGLVVPASTHENDATAQLLDHLAEVGAADRLELVLVTGAPRSALPETSPVRIRLRCVGAGGRTRRRCSGRSRTRGGSR
jgi:hypothetical protein